MWFLGTIGAVASRRSDPSLHLAELTRRAADLVHDLASPLQLASGYLSMLESGRDPDGEAVVLARRALGRAATSLPLLAATVTAAAPPKPAPADPGRVLHDVLDAVGRQSRDRPEVVLREVGRCEVVVDVAQLSCAFELLLVDRRPTCIEAGCVEDDGWELVASGMVPESDGQRPLWELIVERQGGERRAVGPPHVEAITARLWLPVVERRDLA